MSQRLDRLTVTDKETVIALFDNRQRWMLGPFFAGPTTVSAAATETSSLAPTMLYFVRRMVRSGVLTQVDQVKRNGKRVSRYEISANELFIPVDAAEEYMVLPERKFQRLYNEAFVSEIISHHYTVEPLGALIRCLKNGAVEISGTVRDGEFIPGFNGPRVVFEWTTLNLQPERARQFQAELFQLIKQYRSQPAGDTAFYFGLHFAPVPQAHLEHAPQQRGNNPPRL
jgi:hypothetical protein